MKRTRKKIDDAQKMAENGLQDFDDYMQAKYTKLEEQFLHIQNDIQQKSSIFEGISIVVNGHTNPTSEELKRIMMEHGGMYHHYQTNATTFVIASNLPDVKIRSYNSKNVIKPEWITDCLKAGRQVDYSPYLLVTNKNRKQPTLNFEKSVKVEQPKVEIASDETSCWPDMSLVLGELNDKLAENFNKSPKKPTTATSAPLTSTKTVKSAIDPGFLEEFFNNSRLHHIATLGADFKYLISNMRKSHDGKFPERQVLMHKLKHDTNIELHENVVMHIDMDCFFVSVSIRNHPDLRGQPVAVTHSKGKKEFNGEPASMSEIASCSYEARAKGLKNGMFVGQALKMCPNLKTIPYDFDQYRETAMTLYNSVAKYTMDIEAVSCDELYADLIGLLNECEISANDFVSYLRQEIFNATGCTCSVGIGANRLQARMATKRAKPNGQFNLIGENVEEYMYEIPSSELPGVGPHTEFQLKNLNLLKCGDIQACPTQTLFTVFGKKLGESLVMMSKGIDNKKLVYEHVRKSVSVEVNYGIRFNQDEQVNQFMEQVARELSKRLKDIDKRGKLLTLKLMTRAENASVETKKFMGHGVVDRTSKSIPLSSPTNEADIILENVMKLIKSLRLPPDQLRGIGVQMTKFDETKHDESRLLKMFGNHKKLLKKEEDSVKLPGPVIDVKNNSLIDKKVQPSIQRKPGKKSKTAHNVQSIEEMFKKKKTSSDSKNKKLQTIEKLDPDVLAELPPELVEEIMNEYKMPEEDFSENESVCSSKSFAEDNASVRSASTANTEEDDDDIKPLENIFEKNNWRNLVTQKLENGESSEEIGRDLIQLIFYEDIELVDNVMRFLQRKSNENGEERIMEMYKEIEKKVQTAMISKYSKRLNL